MIAVRNTLPRSIQVLGAACRNSRKARLEFQSNSLHERSFFSRSSNKDTQAGDKKNSLHFKISSEELSKMKQKIQDKYDSTHEGFDNAKRMTKETVDSVSKQAREKAEVGKANLTEMWKRYGIVAIGTYFSIYISTLGCLFLIFNNGFLTAADVPQHGDKAAAMLNSTIDRLPESIQAKIKALYSKMKEDPTFRNFVLAWLTTKVTEPVRVLFTIAITPRISRALGRAPKIK